MTRGIDTWTDRWSEWLDEWSIHTSRCMDGPINGWLKSQWEKWMDNKGDDLMVTGTDLYKIEIG